ncbi:MAG: hypothetical protein J2P45_17135 [Candidatus Dormibacteraeota bacterium]|nr:hypothetical protein [Candidatus Dormibacteraeota bacterium]
MQGEGHLLDAASQMELRMLERELHRLQGQAGVLTLSSRTGPPEQREVHRMAQALRAQSAATRAASRQLRKQIIRQNLIDGDGRQSA